MSDQGVLFQPVNIAIVQSFDTSLLPRINVMESLLSFAGDLAGSVKIEPVAPGESREEAMRRLYGAWVEDGDEDKTLEEIYRRRLIPSSSPADEE